MSELGLLVGPRGPKWGSPLTLALTRKGVLGVAHCGFLLSICTSACSGRYLWRPPGADRSYSCVTTREGMLLPPHD